MAAFYWKDARYKMCPSDPDKKCVGNACAAFCMLTELYAYCGLTKEPQKDEFASPPDGFRPGIPFAYIPNTSWVPVKNLPYKNEEE